MTDEREDDRMKHPTTKHGCRPQLLEIEIDGPLNIDALIKRDGVSDWDAVGLTIRYGLGEIAAVDIEYGDGTVDTYEADEVAIALSGWPVCPTDEHHEGGGRADDGRMTG